MQTLVHHQRLLDPVPGDVVRTLSTLDRAAGALDVRKAQNQERLKTLIKVARVQSTEASNAIEDITAPTARLRALMVESTAPADRTEAQIAGYRYMLDLIHASAHDMRPFNENLVKQIHQGLYRATADRQAGAYNTSPNDVTETHPDGTVVMRFKPVAPVETRTVAMPTLQRTFNELRDDGTHHDLLLLAAYVFDFLMIHPFQDGNGRTSRLITLLLLYQAGHDVGRYISLERIINESRDTYYEALQASTTGWHEAQHDIWPWTRYLLGTLTTAYNDLDQRAGEAATHGTIGPAVREHIRNRMTDTFTLDDLRGATPAKDATIKAILRSLQEEQAIEIIHRGRYAKYRRLRTDF